MSDSCDRKKPYRHRRDAARALLAVQEKADYKAEKGKALCVYPCPDCGAWHIGHTKASNITKTIQHRIRQWAGVEPKPTGEPEPLATNLHQKDHKTMNEDLDLNEFLPKDDRLKAELLESSGWDGHAVTVHSVGRKVYPAREDKPEEAKLQVFFEELGNYALECNVTQTKKFQSLFGDRTSQWRGQKVILLSIDSKTPQGQPCKTIQIKEVRAAQNGAGIAAPPPPQTNAPVPMPATNTAPLGLDSGDPFADDKLSNDQYETIGQLCTDLKANAVLVSQNMFNANPGDLSHSQAAALILKLREKLDQTTAALRR